MREPSSGERRATSRRGAAVPAVILGVLLLVAFRGPLSGRLFYLRDVSQNHFPMRHFVTDRLAHGALPLWDPFHGGGTPLLANPDNLVLHPITALFFVLPFDIAFTASILLQYVLLAGGGYLLARALPVGRAPAVLAAVTLTLSGPAASLASLQNVLSAAAWVPIGLWAWLEGFRVGHRWLLAVAAACVAVILIAGDAACLLTFTVLAAILGLTREAGGEGGSPAKRRVSATLIAVLLLGAGIAAAQILPARELLTMSARGGGFPPGEGMRWSLEPGRLFELVVPRLFGDSARLSPEAWWGRWFFQDGYPFLLTIYVGAIPCLLALAALRRRGTGAVRPWSLMAAGAAFLLLALGVHTPIYRALFTAMQVVREIRFPERFVLAILTVLALLAALGLESLLERKGSTSAPVAWYAAASAAAFTALTAVVSAPTLADGFLGRVARVPPALLQSESGAVLRGALVRSLLWTFGETLVLLLGVALLCRRASGRRAAFVGFGIAAVTGLSQVVAAAPALSSSAPGWIEAPSPLASAVEHGVGAARLYHAQRPDSLSIWAKSDEQVWGDRFDRFTYLLKSGHQDSVPIILDAATDWMDLAPQVALGEKIAALPLDARLKVLSICRAGFVLSYEALDHPDLEPGPILTGLSRPVARLYRLRSIVPRARFVARAAAPTHPGDLARSLADPLFDPRREVLLADAAAVGGARGDGDPQGRGSGADPGFGRTAIVEDDAEKIRLLVDAPATGYLVLQDAWSPDWRARVDGSRVPILRADGLFRAVRLGPGSHEVVMTYFPTSLALGLTISAMALAGTLAWGIVMKRTGA